MSVISRSALLRMAGIAALTAAAVLPVTVPSPAHAWWRAGWGWGPGIYVAPPIVVAPPVYAAPVYAAPAYAPGPVYAAPAPGMIWVAPAWIGGVWVGGHWGWHR